MLERCEFPNLPARYDAALRDAVSFILAAFEPVGIIATGTIIRGNPDPGSDLDLWVVHLEPFRQRIQRFFNGVPAEIFVNPPWVIEDYFRHDQADARPISAHMMATGFVVLASDPIVEELRHKARSLLAQPPELSGEAIERARYQAATCFEDANDIADRNPITAGMLLSQALLHIVRFAFLKSRRFIPRDKDLLVELNVIDPQSATEVREFFERSDLNERIRLATSVADRVLGVRGFFEWSSEREAKEKSGAEN